MKRLLIFGAGGHGRELAWTAQRIYAGKVAIEFVVDQPDAWRGAVDGRPIHLFDDLNPCDESCFIAALGDPASRRTAAQKMNTRFRPVSLIDPSTISSSAITISGGAAVMAGCILTTNITILDHAHLNIGCRISHDVVIEEFATLSPGVQISGNVRIGKGAFIGANATLINGTTNAPLQVGCDSVIAAGACVINNVPAGTMVAGVPAMVKRHNY